MCGPASGWSKAAFVILLIAVSIHIAGWATLHWMTYSTSSSVETNIGLWRMESCTSGSCSESSVASQYEDGAFNAVRALETITFCLGVFVLILLLIYMCADMNRRQTFAFVILVILYIAGAASFIGMIIFVTSIPSPFEVSWSMGLTVIAMTLILIAGTLMIPDAFEADYDDYDDDYYNSHRRSVVSPQSLRSRGPPSRGITPVSYRGGVEGSRWRSY